MEVNHGIAERKNIGSIGHEITRIQFQLNRFSTELPFGLFRNGRRHNQLLIGIFQGEELVEFHHQLGGLQSNGFIGRLKTQNPRRSFVPGTSCWSRYLGASRQNHHAERGAKFLDAYSAHSHVDQLVERQSMREARPCKSFSSKSAGCAESMSNTPTM